MEEWKNEKKWISLSVYFKQNIATNRASDMDALWTAQSIQMPPTTTHRVSNLQYVYIRMFAPKCYNR